MPDTLTDVSAKLAAALLVRSGELSVTDIKALPFVENDETVLLIINALSRSFELDIIQRRYDEEDMGWEDVLKLKQTFQG